MSFVLRSDDVETVGDVHEECLSGGMTPLRVPLLVLGRVDPLADRHREPARQLGGRGTTFRFALPSAV